MVFDNSCKIVYNHDKKLIEFIGSLPPASQTGSR
jgi:hypothetical protein